MATIQDQTLSEVVDVADIAVRTASQLRLAKSGRGFTDPAALEHSLEFLARAKKGGAFMSKKTAQLSDTLRPLNWAADTYVKNFSVQGDPNWGEIEEYLNNLETAVRTLMQGGQSTDTSNIDNALGFFETLGSILAAIADQRLRREGSRRAFEF